MCVTWIEIAREQRAAANRLIVPDRVFPRAACSRAYYAAYALLASLAPSGMTFPKGWNNPSHDQLPEIVRSLNRSDRSDIIEIVNRLRDSRIAADYGVRQSVTAVMARERVRDCAELFQRLG